MDLGKVEEMEGKVVTGTFSFGGELGSGGQLLEFKFNTDWVSNPRMPCQLIATTKNYNWAKRPKTHILGANYKFFYIYIIN